MIETFLHVQIPPMDCKVDYETKSTRWFFLFRRKDIHEINECAYQATVKAHSEGEFPV